MLEVIEPGALSTVQDGGRLGYLDQGVPPSGAVDRWSLAVANLLLGNRADAAALEMTLLGPTLAVRTTGVVAIAGADLEAEVVEEGLVLAPGASYLVRAGTTLCFGAARDGVRAYLALAGGIAVETVLGSASTCLAGGFGGLDGRAVRVGDVLRAVSPPGAASAGRRWPRGAFDVLGDGPIAIVPTGRAAGVHDGALAALQVTTWSVSPWSDRTGVRLAGDPLPTGTDAGSLLSRGMVPGAIQVPPAGEPIVLLADGPTVGGYPVPAVVASADLGRLAQRPTGADVRFLAVSIPQAQAMWRQQAALLGEAAAALTGLDPRLSGV
ncbi:MAG: biotin-dependent carboxyltransferase family protein [Candidatus Limnocylindrales bacterium]